MAFTNLEKTDMVLIYGEARDIQSQHGKSTVKGFLEEYFPNPNARTFVNVVQHLRDFGRFEIKKRDLGRQRENFFTKLKTTTNKYSASCRSSERFSVCGASSKRPSGNLSKQRNSESKFGLFGHVVLKLALQTMAGVLSSFFDAFTRNYSLFTLLFI
jgi:hypothetical protein